MGVLAFLLTHICTHLYTVKHTPTPTHLDVLHYTVLYIEWPEINMISLHSPGPNCSHTIYLGYVLLHDHIHGILHTVRTRPSTYSLFVAWLDMPLWASVGGG